MSAGCILAGFSREYRFLKRPQYTRMEKCFCLATLYHVLQDKSINFVNFIYQPKSSPNRTTLPAGCCAERELVQQVNDSGEGVRDRIAIGRGKHGFPATILPQP